MKKLISVRFRSGGKTELYDPGEYNVALGDCVVVMKEHGIECGEVAKAAHSVPDAMVPKTIKTILRMADGVDVRRMKQNQADQEKAMVLCNERIAKHGLDMKLIEVEYSFDRSKIMFYFTSDGRVDFRDLVKDLAGLFHTRIELRQIGVRDESKMLGGLGICGQPFCCNRFLNEFQPVSIKMAKEQGLSLNPTKISGSCGRLMCCLSYEQDAYEYLNSIYPMAGSTVRTPDGVGTVLETNPVTGYLKVRGHYDTIAPKYYKAATCEYISGGKRAPKKPDIEDDYSGMNQNPAPVVASSEQGTCPKQRNAQNANGNNAAPAQKQNNTQNQSQNDGQSGGQNGGRNKQSNYRGNRRK